MFVLIWKGYFLEENYVGYVINGVYLFIWCVVEWKKFFKDNFDENFFCDQFNQKIWEVVYGILDEEIWNIWLKQKVKLLDYIKSKCSKDWFRSQVDLVLSVFIFERFNFDVFLIGFGCCFVIYKRVYFLFMDID